MKIGIRQKEKHVGEQNENILQVSMATWRVLISCLMFSQANSFFVPQQITAWFLSCCLTILQTFSNAVSPVKIANCIVSSLRLRGSARLTHTVLVAFAIHFNNHAYSVCFCMPHIIFKSTVGTCAWPHCTVQCINTALDQLKLISGTKVSLIHNNTQHLTAVITSV